MKFSVLVQIQCKHLKKIVKYCQSHIISCLSVSWLSAEFLKNNLFGVWTQFTIFWSSFSISCLFAAVIFSINRQNINDLFENWKDRTVFVTFRLTKSNHGCDIFHNRIRFEHPFYSQYSIIGLKINIRKSVNVNSCRYVGAPYRPVTSLVSVGGLNAGSLTGVTRWRLVRSTCENHHSSSSSSRVLNQSRERGRSFNYRVKRTEAWFWWKFRIETLGISV